MQFANRWLLIAFASLSLGACAATPKHVASAAEYDLSCGRVSVSKIDDDHYAASGCGRGAVYTRTCDGGNCRWGRLRHGHEVEVANGFVTDPNAGALPPREVLEAPAPAQREVLPAPAPDQREVLPAPAPGSSQAPAAASDGTSAAPADASAVQGSTQGLVQTDNTQQLALSYGDVSNVQTQIPATQSVQRVQYAPPVALVETRPPQPYYNYVWIGGYWWWGSLGWTWVPGYWCPPYYGYSYIGGGWYWYNSWWWYYPGGWGYPGTRTVIYTPAPRTNVITTTRTFHPHSGVMTGMGNSHVAAAPVRSISPTQAFRPQQSPLLHSNNSAQAAQAFHGTTPSNTTRFFQPNAPARTWATPSTTHSFVSPSHTVSPSTTHSFVSPGRIVSPNQPSFPRSSYQTQAFHGSSTPSSSFHYSAPHYSAPPRMNTSSSFRSSRPPPSSFSTGAFRGGGGGGFHGGGGGFHGGGGGGFHGGHH